MLREMLCGLGWHVRQPDYIGTKMWHGRKRYAYYCCSCGRSFTRARKLAE